VKKYYEQGLSDSDMQEKVARDLASYKNWVGLDDELGKLISLAYLQVEADSFD
jgi:hypothetical protein